MSARASWFLLELAAHLLFDSGHSFRRRNLPPILQWRDAAHPPALEGGERNCAPPRCSEACNFHNGQDSTFALTARRSVLCNRVHRATTRRHTQMVLESWKSAQGCNVGSNTDVVLCLFKKLRLPLMNGML